MGDWTAGAGLFAAVGDGYEMTKLEELALRLAGETEPTNVQLLLQTALKPLLDALERAWELLDEYPDFRQEIGEQLSQWRKP